MLGVRRAGLLFSDLSASTAMYARAGDAKAYAFVQDHFDLATRILHAHDGALVKTIGDAVMAVFEDDAALVRAACALQRAFSVFRAGRPEADGVYLRLGACAGPVFAATANCPLDYFGQTVNTAARLQSLAAPGEIVLGESLHSAMAGALGEDAHISAGEHVSVKGLATLQNIVRVRVS